MVLRHLAQHGHTFPASRTPVCVSSHLPIMRHPCSLTHSIFRQYLFSSGTSARGLPTSGAAAAAGFSCLPLAAVCPGGAPLTCRWDKVVQLPTAVPAAGHVESAPSLVDLGFSCGCPKPTHVVNIVAVHSASARGLLIGWFEYAMVVGSL